jgi:hypothetical protein
MHDLFKPAAETSERWYWTPAVVGVFGFLSIVLLAATLWANERRMAENVAVSRAVADLQSAAGYWHLWLEEYLTGDRWVDVERDVRGNQRLATGLASMLLRGGRRDDGEKIEALADPRLRRVAERLEAELAGFESLAEERLARPAEAGVGTDLDQRFDAIFQRVKSHAVELGRLEREYLEADRTTFRLRAGAAVAVWTLIVAAALAGLSNREKRRQEAQDALRKSQNWLATTLSSIGDAVVTTDLAGRVYFMNPVAERLTGWPREEAKERPIDEVFRIWREADGLPAENPVTKVLGTGENAGMANHTVLVDRRDENRYGIDEGAAPIRDDQGRLLGAVLVFRDVSRRRRTEKALRDREAELQQAQKMEAVGRLAGGIAHDVNNYLGAIRGYCEVAMMKGESGPSLVRRMTSAVETADKVSALIRQLLAFSRRQPVQPAVMDLNRVVAGMKGLIERLLGEDIILETRLHSGLRSVEIDRSQIEQTLVNLALNARDAMPTGGRIVIATGEAELGPAGHDRHPGARPGAYVRLSVSDTGCGIPPEVRSKIFDPFFTTKAASGSSGLGLATVYGIARQNGGFITFETEVDEGTTFEIYLPASDRPADGDDAAAGAAVAAGERLRVLLVEDHAAMRASARALLEVQGHDVRTAADGDEALSLLGETEVPFDLLITDVIMPGMSGRELYNRVRERFGDVRCLFISGYTDNVMMRHGFSQERMHFLAKPFSSADLTRKIAEVLEESEGSVKPSPAV